MGRDCGGFRGARRDPAVADEGRAEERSVFRLVIEPAGDRRNARCFSALRVLNSLSFNGEFLICANNGRPTKFINILMLCAARNHTLYRFSFSWGYVEAKHEEGIPIYSTEV